MKIMHLNYKVYLYVFILLTTVPVTCHLFFVKLYQRRVHKAVVIVIGQLIILMETINIVFRKKTKAYNLSGTNQHTYVVVKVLVL